MRHTALLLLLAGCVTPLPDVAKPGDGTDAEDDDNGNGDGNGNGGGGGGGGAPTTDYDATPGQFLPTGMFMSADFGIDGDGDASAVSFGDDPIPSYFVVSMSDDRDRACDLYFLLEPQHMVYAGESGGPPGLSVWLEQQGRDLGFAVLPGEHDQIAVGPDGSNACMLRADSGMLDDPFGFVLGSQGFFFGVGGRVSADVVDVWNDQLADEIPTRKVVGGSMKTPTDLFGDALSINPDLAVVVARVNGSMTVVDTEPGDTDTVTFDFYDADEVFDRGDAIAGYYRMFAVSGYSFE